MSMLTESTWIRENVSAPLGVCKESSHTFVKAFPDYEIRCGFFHSALWGARQHWWCRHKRTGKIVDPTGEQFPDGALFPLSDAYYEDLTDLSEDELRSKVPTGVCAECGGPVFNLDAFCTAKCAELCIGELNQRLAYDSDS